MASSFFLKTSFPFEDSSLLCVASLTIYKDAQRNNRLYQTTLWTVQCEEGKDRNKERK